MCCLSMGTTDISSFWESSKKIPFWIKYGEKGKVKGAKFIIVYGEQGLFFPGVEFLRFLGGREVGSVFAIKGKWVSANEGDH